MPLPEAVGIVIGGVLFFTVLTGIGLAVTMAVASAMLKYRSEAARMHLCRFGDVQFLPDRLKWTLDKAALRDFVFRPGIAPWSLLAGMTAVAAILLQWELSLLKDPPSMLVSIAPAVAALSLAGLAAAAGALVFWRGSRFIRSRQEYACREIIGDSAARWEKIAAAAVPKLKELQELSGEIIAVGETAGWRLTTEAPPQHGSGGLSRYLGSDDDTLRLNYLSAAARYFAGHPGQRWRDDTALIRLALDAAQRDLRKGKAAFPDAAACYWEALAAGWMPRICYTVAWWTGGGSARGDGGLKTPRGLSSQPAVAAGLSRHHCSPVGRAAVWPASGLCVRGAAGQPARPRPLLLSHPRI